MNDRDDREILEALQDLGTIMGRVTSELPPRLASAVDRGLHMLADAIDAEAADLRAEQVSQHQVVSLEAEAALLVARILSGALRRIA